MDRYENIQLSTTKSGRKYRENVIYPSVDTSDDDIYVITSEGDRLDKLAWEFYNNVEYWWIIASANPTVSITSMAVPTGVQLRIPANPESYLVKYGRINS